MIEQFDESSMDSTIKSYLTLSLGNELYGIDMLKVKEMRRWGKVTALPMTPESLCGLVNLRGEVIPVFDLRLCLGMEKIAPSTTTIIIILDVNDPQKQLASIVGLVVDAVLDPYEIAEQDIKPAPDLGDASYIKGLSEVGDDIVTLLDTDIILSVEALA